MMIGIKKLVSGTRRRMEDDNLNIDLTYICHNRIIVMSYPASGLESGYRNSYVDVSAQIFSIKNYKSNLNFIFAPK